MIMKLKFGGYAQELAEHAHFRGAAGKSVDL